MAYARASNLWTSGIVPEYLFFDELELTITRL
jgi:hypothetical protein